jgi:hypothetical protein
MELLHDSGLFGSVDIVELNPFLDERGQDGAGCGRADRQSVRPANHGSSQPLAICRGTCCL